MLYASKENNRLATVAWNWRESLRHIRLQLVSVWKEMPDLFSAFESVDERVRCGCSKKIGERLIFSKKVSTCPQ